MQLSKALCALIELYKYIQLLVPHVLFVLETLEVIDFKTSSNMASEKPLKIPKFKTFSFGHRIMSGINPFGYVWSFLSDKFNTMGYKATVCVSLLNGKS